MTTQTRDALTAEVLSPRDTHTAATPYTTPHSRINQGGPIKGGGIKGGGIKRNDACTHCHARHGESWHGITDMVIDQRSTMGRGVVADGFSDASLDAQFIKSRTNGPNLRTGFETGALRCSSWR